MLNVPVSYRLQEYLQILFDFAPLEHHRRAVLKGKAAPDEQPRKMSWYIKGMLCVVGSAAYFYKVSKVGACNFQVHSGGVDPNFERWKAKDSLVRSNAGECFKWCISRAKGKRRHAHSLPLHERERTRGV